MSMDALMQDLISGFILTCIIFLSLAITLSIGAASFYGFILLTRLRKRDKQSLSMVTIEIKVPKDNEIKIDAAEQLFASLAGLKTCLLYTSDRRTYAMVELLLQTGIRIGELADIKVSDISDDGLKTVGRTIPLNKAVSKAIKDYMKSRHQSDTEHLFVTKTGRALLVRNIRSIITRCFREVGIDNAKVQDLRNTFIAYQLQNGASISYISKIVGHKRLSSTEKYMDLIQQEAEKKERLGEL